MEESIENKQQTKVKEVETHGNLYKQRAIHKGNFTILHNEILFMKDEYNNAVNLETIGLFWRLMSFPSSWHLTIKGISALTGETTDKISKCLNKLISWGYVQKIQTKDDEGKFGNFIYRIQEVLDENLWNNTDSEIIDIQDENAENPLLNLNSSRNLDSRNPGLRNPDSRKMDSRNPEIRGTYKIYNNKVPIDKVFTNKESNNKKQNFCFSLISNIKNNTSSKGTLEELTEYSGPFSEEKQVDSQDADIKKNKSKLKKSNKSNNRKSVDEILTKTVGDNTDMENEIARCKKQINELSEKSKEQERKVGKNLGKKKRLLNHIESTFSTQPEIMSALKDFAEMYMERKNVLTTASFDLLIKDLYAITTDPKEMLNVINNSIKKSYLGFYPESNCKQTGSSFNRGKIDSKINIPTTGLSGAKSEDSKINENNLEADSLLKDLKTRKFY